MEPMIALTTAVIFFVLVLAFHFIKPNLNPATHMISEYAIGKLGWIMQLAFYCLAISCFMIALVVLPFTTNPTGAVILIVTAIGAGGAGFFITDPVGIAKQKQTRASILHMIFSNILISLFPIAATAISLSLSSESFAETTRQLLFWLSILTWVGFVSFLGVTALLFVSIKKRLAPNIRGYLQRFMAITYLIWLIAASLAFWH
jgi:hypothetical protein